MTKQEDRQKQAIATAPDAEATRQRVSVVVVGHVDHGKSTLIGRLLADTGNLPEGKLEALQERCARNSKPLEYAFLLDALKDEQAQGITIDTARCFFKTALRDYIIIDAPGHIEFLKNMVSGAARADAALLMIDAREGVQENSRRHGYFLSMLGIEQFAVCINKMDLVDYRQDVFDRICAEYGEFLAQIPMKPFCFVPLNAHGGDNVAQRSERMPWYQGPSIAELLDRFTVARTDTDKPFRMPVQDVYKFTAMGDNRRIIAGRIEAGGLRVGDGVVFLPSGKRSHVKTLESFPDKALSGAATGQCIGFTTTEQVYVRRGDIVCREDQTLPQVSARIRVDLFWLGHQPLTLNKAYKFKLGAAEVQVQVEKIVRVLNASNMAVEKERAEVRRHEVAECILRTRQPVAVDVCTDSAKTGRFVLVDGYVINGGGIVREVLADEESGLRREAIQRDIKWIQGEITPELRAERYAQRAALILISGPKGVGRKTLARALEQQLFAVGRMVYYLGMGSIVHGLDADISHIYWEPDKAGREHVRRLGELLHVLLDAGLIVICTAQELSAQYRNDLETLIAPVPIVAIDIGPTRGESQLALDTPYEVGVALPTIVDLLKSSRIIPDL